MSTNYFRQAEINAKKRDLQVEKEKFIKKHNGVNQENFNNALNVITKATGQEICVYTKRSTKNKTKFVQMIQDNWDYMLETGYLRDEEILFLIRIQRFLQFKSNCLVDNIHAKNSVPLTQKQIAERLKTGPSKVSRIVNTLVDKGIIIKAQGQKISNNNVRTYALFVNPNVMYSGEKDNIEQTLKILFTNAKPLLKNFPIALF